ncbi:MAG: glycosyltransferase family 9 protein [Planctomycetota bacterium]
MSGKRYLILRLSALGDILFALDALEALARAEPDARIDWLVEDRWRALLEGHPRIDRLLVYERRALTHALPRPWRWPGLLARIWRHLRALRAERYDAVLDLHGNLKSGLHVLLSRARRKLGFMAPRAREGSWLFYRERLLLPEPLPHRAEEGLLLAGRLVDRRLPPPEGDLLPRHPEAERAARTMLERHPAGAGPAVLLAPGTSHFAAFKRWPTTAFRALARTLADDGCRVLLSQGPGEGPLVDAILDDDLRGRVLVVDGAALGLEVLVETLRLVTTCVAADSGPLHLAQAVGTPVVALFGPKDPDRYGPRGRRSIVLRYPVPCAPCGLRSCPAPLCVQAIPPAEVARAVHEILAEAREPAAT